MFGVSRRVPLATGPWKFGAQIDGRSSSLASYVHGMRSRILYTQAGDDCLSPVHCILLLYLGQGRKITDRKHTWSISFFHFRHRHVKFCDPFHPELQCKCLSTLFLSPEAMQCFPKALVHQSRRFRFRAYSPMARLANCAS